MSCKSYSWNTEYDTEYVCVCCSWDTKYDTECAYAYRHGLPHTLCVRVCCVCVCVCVYLRLCSRSNPWIFVISFPERFSSCTMRESGREGGREGEITYAFHTRISHTHYTHIHTHYTTLHTHKHIHTHIKHTYTRCGGWGMSEGFKCMHACINVCVCVCVRARARA